MRPDATAAPGDGPSSAAGLPGSARAAALASAALLLVAFNLRGPIAGVPPVADEIRSSLGVPGSVVGLVTTLPLLCFAIAAPGGPILARRWRNEQVILAALVLIGVGMLLRSAFGVAWLLTGTLVLGVGIAAVNVLLPPVIKDWYPRPGLMTGMYAMGMSTGGALAAITVIPLDRALGGWVPALACWGVFVAAAIVVWWPYARTPRVATPRFEPRPSVMRDGGGWLLAGMFGCVTLLAFAGLAWIPSIAGDAGVTAQRGAGLLTLYLLVGVPAAIAAPLLVERCEDRRPLVLAFGAVWVGALGGLLVAPSALLPLSVIGLGIAQGGGFALVLALVVVRATDARHAVALSGMAQGTGYLIAAIGPTAVGALYDATDGWAASLGLLLGVTAVFVVLGMAAGRPLRSV